MGSVARDEKRLLEYARKSTAPPFLLKTYKLVEDPATDDVISWNGDGTGFVVWQAAEFARDILPTLFKHSNFSSFIRQLNTYGFRKVATGRWEFCNDMFKRGERELLSKIRRRKAWTNKPQHPLTYNNIGPANQTRPQDHQLDQEDQKSSSTSSSSGHYSTLIDENKRLKKENGVLTSELVSTRRKCNQLLDLIAKHAEALNEDGRPKLFGVRLH